VESLDQISLAGQRNDPRHLLREDRFSCCIVLTDMKITNILQHHVEKTTF
jgi:hypothetical protein